MSINTNNAGFLRGQIVLQDRTIGRDFLKYLQALETLSTQLVSFAVNRLPQNPKPIDGSIAFASNGRKQGEGPGAGTGVPVYYSANAWRRYSDDTPVTA
jgi:hypothetical protein